MLFVFLMIGCVFCVFQPWSIDQINQGIFILENIFPWVLSDRFTNLNSFRDWSYAITFSRNINQGPYA